MNQRTQMANVYTTMGKIIAVVFPLHCITLSRAADIILTVVTFYYLLLFQQERKTAATKQPWVFAPCTIEKNFED